MSAEYKWFKKGSEHRRTTDPEGKLTTLVKLTPNTEIHYKYREDGSVRVKSYQKNSEYHGGNYG